MSGLSSTRMRARLFVLAGALAIVFGTASPTLAASVTNGEFNSAYTGWTLNNLGNGSWYTYSGTTSPISGHAIYAPPSGSVAVVTDQNGSGRNLLYQNVTLEPFASHTFSAIVFAKNWSAAWVTQPNLALSNNQQYRVDVMKPTAAIDSVAAADIFATPFQTQPTDAQFIPPKTITANLTAQAGQTVRLRFAAVDTNFFLNAGADAVSITTNFAPVAQPLSVTTAEDTAKAITLVATDAEGNPITYELVSSPTHGVLSGVAGSSVTYTPSPNYSGNDSFSYRARDAGSIGPTRTVSITVTPVNDPPVAVDDATTTSEDSPAVIDVLVNDSDLEGAVSLRNVFGASRGTTEANPDGTVTYTPDANYHGPDSFLYRIQDADGVTALATVDITVSPVNDPPTAATDVVSLDEDSSQLIDVLTNDTDVDSASLSVTEISPPANGTAELQPDGTVLYSPNENFHGADLFTYTVTDGSDSSVGRVEIEVLGVNDTPEARDDEATTEQYTPVKIDVLANDEDIDLDALSISSVSAPAQGTARIEPDGTITYTPGAGFRDRDEFTYTVDDGNGGSDTATVVVREAGACVEDGSRRLGGTPAEGAISGPIDREVEPRAGMIDPSVAQGINDANCTLIVPIEDQIDRPI